METEKHSEQKQYHLFPNTDYNIQKCGKRTYPAHVT